jgi:drug/metabolite transporter (DMT)-like permease
MLALVTSVGAMLAFATLAICARFMKDLDFAVIQSNSAIFGVCLISILLFFDSKNYDRPAYVYEVDNVFSWMITAGVINGIAKNLMVVSMQHSNPVSVSLYAYSGVIYGLVWDFFVFKTEFHFM